MRQALSITALLCLATLLSGCGEKHPLGVKKTATKIDPPVIGAASSSAAVGALTIVCLDGTGLQGLDAALRTHLAGKGLAEKGAEVYVHSLEINQRKTGPPDRGSKFGSAVVTLRTASGDPKGSYRIEVKTDSTELRGDETWTMIHGELMRGFAEAIVDAY